MSQILCVFVEFWCFGGVGVSIVGHFRTLETPGGDLGFQGSILGPKTRRKSTFWTLLWDGFWILLGSVFEVILGKTSGSRFLTI